MQFMRESVFVSAIRSFCTSFMAVIGIGLAILLVIFGIATSLGRDWMPPSGDVTILPDGNGIRKVLPMNSPVVLCLRIDNVIGLNELTSQNVRNLLIDSREGILATERVKAILLLMNTPGGAATDSDDIYRALKEYSAKYNVPVYAYVDGFCASGGMFIASAAKKIYATPASIIGSVGVKFGPTFNFSQAMDKIGIQSLTLTEGKDKDFLNPFRPWKEGEDASLREAMACFYERFVSIVSEARPLLTKDKLINVYGANVYAAQKAKEYGFIDADDADYSFALNDLVKEVGLSDGKGYQVVELSAPRSFFTGLPQSSLLKMAAKCFGISFPSFEEITALRGKALYIYEPGIRAN